MKDVFRWHYWPKEKPQGDDAEDIEYLLCISAEVGATTYDHAVIAGDCYYEGGEWFIHGAGAGDAEIHAWMPFPEPPQSDISLIIEAELRKRGEAE